MQKISDAELEVLQAVWRCGGVVSSADLHRELLKTRDWKQNTVITFLARLSDKGLIQAEKAGRGRPGRYAARLTEEEYRRAETLDFLEEVHGGDVASLMTALGGGEALTRSQLSALRDWFDGLEGG